MTITAPILKAALAAGILICAGSRTTHEPLSGALPHVPPLRALIIGGGPDAKSTQVAIESNVRYTERILPKGTSKRVLFTDGNPSTKCVQFLDSNEKERYRPTTIPDVDGPAVESSVSSEFSRLAKTCYEEPKSPVLIYFTGHGSPDPESQYQNNGYALWGESDWRPEQMANSFNAFPKSSPLVLVMVQCYSGAFGNALFQKADPNGALSDRSICGFFASVPQRMAAGCTPSVNEEDYHDFTGDFFAALCGKDRMGRPVTGVDYNHDGRIGMNEAFAYALIHEDSIDTPVCTSDVFLRRFVKTSDPQVFRTAFSDALLWSTPSQRAVLNALSTSLGYSSDDRLSTAYAEFRRMNPESEEMRDVHLIRFVRVAKSVVLAHTLMASSDEPIKRRFVELLKAEGQNPFRPE